MDAVELGSRWYDGLQQEFGHVRSTPSYQDALARLKARRQADLLAAEEAMLDGIEEASITSLDSLVSGWFRSEMDDGSPVRQRVESAAVERRERHLARIDAEIAEAERRARQEATNRPGAPLRFIDFRRFPKGQFLSFIYYGLEEHPTSADLARMMGDVNFDEIMEISVYSSKIKSAFASYHHLYGRRYGKTPAQRQASGEEWSGVHSGTVTTNASGEVLERDFDAEPFMYIRKRYADAYERSQVDHIDALVAIFGAAAKAVEGGGDQREQDARFTKEIFGTILTSGLDFVATFAPFLDEFKESHPATVAHFEENLRRALQLEPLLTIDKIEPGK